MRICNLLHRPRLSVQPVLLALLFFLGGCGSTAPVKVDQAPSVPPLTPDQVRLNLESFDVVWTTVRDKHWDPDLGGIDWIAVRDELRPRVEQATTMAEARSAMREMIGRLGQSHFGIIPASVYEDAAAASGGDPEENHGGDGATGLDVRVRDGRILVVDVWSGSAADQAGVRPGWEVLTVDGTSLASRLEELQSSLHEGISQGLVLSMAMKARLRGDVGQTLPVEFLDGDGRQTVLDLVLQEARGKKVTLGNLPEVRVWHESRTLPGGSGYFRFNFFLGIMEVMPAFNLTMTGHLDAPGMIIDLRGNLGGLGAMAMGMSGWFVEGKGHQLGVMTMRTGEINFAINPRARTYTGPLAILVDELSASTSEIMAGGLQDLGRARLFGVTTAGAALPSVIEKLPNGDGFQYAVANYVSRGGRQLEGNGVVPDVEVAATRESLLRDGDPVLKAAAAWIASRPGASAINQPQGETEQ